MSTTNYERVVTWLPPVDRAKLDRDAALVAQETFLRSGDFAADAMRFREALEAATETLVDMRRRRDQAAVAVSRYWVVRPGADLPSAIGVSRAAWSSIRLRYENQTVRDFRTAPVLLAKYAALAHLAGRIAELGREARDHLAQDMADSGMTNTQIAARLGLSQSQVSRRITWQPKRIGVRAPGP